MQRHLITADRVGMKKSSNPPVPSDAAAAYTELIDEISAVRDEELLPVNLDVERAASIALATAAHLRPLLPVFKGLPEFDQSAPKKLRRYALAALYAHVVASEPVRDDNGFTPLLDEAIKLRELLLGTAEMLALFGLVSAERVAEIKLGSGHLDTASDLIALRALFGERWEQLRGKTPVTQEQVERAGVVGTALHEMVASRRFTGPPSPSVDDSRRLRAKAFTLLVRKYDECRRGVTFLRWQYGDADKFAPSIYIKGRRRPSTRVVEDEETPQTETPLTPPPSDVPPAPTDAVVVA